VGDRLGARGRPVISVLIPVKDGGEDVVRCIEAVQRQTTEEEFEVVAVDSGSEDGTPERIRRLGGIVHEIPAEDFSHGGTRNLLRELARGEVLVYVTDDTLPAADDWLATLVAALGSRPDAAAAYGRQIPHADASPSEQYFLRFLYGTEPRVQRARNQDELTLETTMLSNANAAYRRDALEAHPFAEDLRWAEEQDFARRVLLEGKTVVYEPRAAVIHSHAYTISTAFHRFFDSGLAARRTYLSGGAPARRALGSSLRRYAVGEIGWLWNQGHAAWIPYAVAYELAKLAGMELGIHGDLLPEWVRARLGVESHPRRRRA
jgi:rhamnosyltransferase